MSKFRFITSMAGCGALLALLGPAVHASTWDKRTVVDLPQRIEVPGTTLEPGKYVFQVANLVANRNVVQITNERGNHVYTTALAIPAERGTVPEKTILTFYEMPSGQPEALKTWYYPGDSSGFQFTYPEGRAHEISAVTKQNVPATPSDFDSKSAAASVATSDTDAKTLNSRSESNEKEKAEVAPVAVSPAPEPAAAPAPVEIAQATPAPPAVQEPSGSATTTAAAAEPPATTLPKTASPVPMIAGFGLLGLAGALSLRKLAQASR